jgi:hypothetical protein
MSEAERRNAPAGARRHRRNADQGHVDRREFQGWSLTSKAARMLFAAISATLDATLKMFEPGY